MPKIVDHDAYRGQIVERAIQLFVAQGYGGLGLRELAATLGISKSALYHYYPSKEALFQDVVETAVRSAVVELTAQTPVGASFADRFAAFVDYVLANEDGFVQDLLILTEYARLREGAEGAPQMHAAAAQYAAAIATFLGVAPEEGMALYLQLNGALMQRFLDNRQTDLHAALAWACTILSQKYDPRF
jgi:AcrR family transcriptional regulator